MLDGVSLDQSLTFMASPDEGWGGMPLHAVSKDIAEGRLIELSIEDIPAGGLKLPMAAVYRVDAPPGPAGRWIIDRLKACSEGAS